VLGGSVALASDGGLFFTLDENGNLSARDVTSGAHVWTTQLQQQSFYDSPPVAFGGKVYVNGLGSGGTTIALDSQTGAVLWTAGTFDGSDGCVAVAGGVVYEAEACDQLSAFDAATGQLLWFHSGACTGGGGAAPAVHQGLIWERDWATGDVILDTSGNVQGAFSADTVPSFHAGTVFYEKAGTLSAVDIQSSTLKWSFTGDGTLCTSAVVAGAGQVFVGSSSGKVYELDEMTGAQTSADDLGMAVTCGDESHAMAVAGGHLLVPTGDKLVVY
jgi:outer membrane protein assembly factor BamB